MRVRRGSGGAGAASVGAGNVAGVVRVANWNDLADDDETNTPVVDSSGNPAGFLLPLLHQLHGVHAIAPDRPGVGLSDPVDLPVDRYREAAVAWLDRLLDTLELDTTALVGHSGGGVLALWYALAHPDRVQRLVLLGVPTLPGTGCPLPIRLVVTPALGLLLSRLAPPSPTSVLRFAHHVARERAALASEASGRDPSAPAAGCPCP